MLGFPVGWEIPCVSRLSTCVNESVIVYKSMRSMNAESALTQIVFPIDVHLHVDLHLHVWRSVFFSVFL